MTTHPQTFAFDRKFVPPDTYDAFFAVVERLEATIEGETAALATHRPGAVANFTRQKHQGFLELDRIMRAIEACIPSQDIIARIASFKRKLEANDVMLRTHLKAAQEVTEIIVRVMRESESDGTYSRSYARADYGFA